MDNNMTWRALIADLTKMTEEEVKSAINYEVATANRKSIVVRLHQRYTRLRARRERDNLAKGELL